MRGAQEMSDISVLVLSREKRPVVAKTAARVQIRNKALAEGLVKPGRFLSVACFAPECQLHRALDAC
ncbi:hypothetical protein GCM10007207_07930 [Asaia siamensis]|uniref:Uncharacterized protein n=1 Tax=Asaia siamensis TaxID=110479 RepID=A0ABQ1LMZ7_9PROT|nr:hypothetical protein GCM10007207_07930 [Asaia siamensis]